MAATNVREQNVTGPSSWWLIGIWALLLAWFVTGVFDRFPWKADEPYSFGIVWEMLEDHQWLIPQVADQPFVEKPPLVYWVAAAFAKAMPAVEPLESTRLAILFFAVIGVAAMYAAARRLHREMMTWVAFVERHGNWLLRDAIRLTPHAYATLGLLLMVGTLGFAETIHKLVADIGQLAGTILGLCGVIWIGTAGVPDSATDAARRSGIAGGLMLGMGVGIAFMSKGLLVPCLLLATCACLLTLPAYRTRAACMAFAIAAIAALPWVVVWPALLHATAPDLFDQWLWGNNIGRFTGSTSLGGNRRTIASKLASLSLAGFPALLLAAYTISRTHRAIVTTSAEAWVLTRNASGHLAVAVFLLVSAVVLCASASLRDVYFLPLLPPMVLLGLPALALKSCFSLSRIRRAASVAFALVVAIVAVTWFLLVTTGDLTALLRLDQRVGRLLPLPFHLAIHWLAVVATASAVLVWIQVVRHDVLRSLTVAWCAGFALLWIVVASLLLPWIDAARSYREVFTEIGAHVTDSRHCIAALNLGESELAMLEYVTGMETSREYLGSGSGNRADPNPAALDCYWLVVLSNRASGMLDPDPNQWRRVWAGSRPADRSERFVLYQAAQSRSPRALTRSTLRPVE